MPSLKKHSKEAIKRGKVEDSSHERWHVVALWAASGVLCWGRADIEERVVECSKDGLYLAN